MIGPSVDVDLASSGYLRGRCGRTRFVHGLDAIAGDTVLAGIDVRWGDPPDGRAGCSLLWRRVIVLAGWLIDADPEWIRDVWAHELAHHAVSSTSCGRARAWQERHYPELVEAV